MTYINNTAGIRPFHLNAGGHGEEGSRLKEEDVPPAIPVKIRDKLGRRDRHLLELAVIACLAWFWIANPDQKPLMSLLLASSVLILGIFPLWHWIGQSPRDAIPVLPIHGLFYMLYFGIEGFIDSGNLGFQVHEYQLQSGLICAAVGLLSLYIAYYNIAPVILPKKISIKWPFVFNELVYGRVLFILYPSFMLMDLAVSRHWPLFSQYFSAIHRFLFFCLLHAFFSGKLRKIARWIFAFIVLPSELLFFSGFTDTFLAGIVMTILLIAIVYFKTKGRVPYKWLILAAGILLLLNPVKSEFRDMVWRDHIVMSPVQKIITYFDLGIDYYLGNTSRTPPIETAWGSIAKRIDYLSVTSQVMAVASATDSFYHGQTYLPLLTKWIPRLIWPGKPKEDFGNIWGRQYGILDADDYTTSLDLALLPEMYINFGMMGVVSISLLIGILFRFLRDAFWRDPRDSTSFAFGIAVGSQLMLPESNLSMLLGGVLIFTVTIYAFMLLLSWFSSDMVMKIR